MATHPSDMCVALAALGATVFVEGKNGQREIAFNDFHRLPGDTPQIETDLQADELIKAIEILQNDFVANSLYRKVRDRSSYAFALVSVAAALELQNNVIANVRIALGGVSHKPWRAFETERSGHRRKFQARS
ncbi:FAD binding domain-containing protein [Methylobacter sp.]|uniref:FAD binding domain-containing protein n=1 Tax=Methylobacter sp. TaxID=2051955 RepID=UPI002FDCF4B0